MSCLSISELTTYRWTFEEDVRNYLAAGVNHMGVWREKLSDFGEARGIELLRDHGMRVSNLFWAGGFTGSDGSSYRENVTDAIDAIRLAAELEADCLLVYGGAQGGHIVSHAQELIHDALVELAPCAREHNVVLAVEPMHVACASGWTLLNELQQTLDLIDGVDDQFVKLAFDCYHLGHELGMLDRLAEIADRIGIVQLGDARKPPGEEQDRCRLGEGQLPIREMVDILHRSGYRGHFEIELVGQEIEICQYDDLLRHSIEAFEGYAAALT